LRGELSFSPCLGEGCRKEPRSISLDLYSKKSLKIVKEFKLQVGVRGTPACREGEMEGNNLDINAGKDKGYKPQAGKP